MSFINHSILRFCAVAALLALACAPALKAECIVVQPADDSQPRVLVAIDALKEIKFDGDKILLNATDKTHSFSIGEVGDLHFSDETPAGIENVTAESKTFSVYPNPTEGILNIQLTDDVDTSRCKVAIYNLSGRALWTLTGLTSTQLDVTALPSGIYFLTINNNTVKFIKK